MPSSSKIRYKLNVFGGISFEGSTPFAVFTENMDSEMYAEIIRSVIFPFSIEKYGSQMSLHQDNDPKHSSRLCVKTMDAYKINWVSKNKNILY
jgi:hypothetical protein